MTQRRKALWPPIDEETVQEALERKLEDGVSIRKSAAELGLPYKALLFHVHRYLKEIDEERVLRGGYPFTDADMRQVLQRWNAGVPLAGQAERLGVPAGTMSGEVSRYLASFGVKIPLLGGPHRYRLGARMEKWRDKGLTFEQAAAREGVPTPVAWGAYHHYLRKRQGRVLQDHHERMIMDSADGRPEDDGAPDLPAAVAAKVGEGHTFETDPAHGLSSVARWTCKVCGDAVLDSGPVIYGGATERTCAESLVFWAQVAP